MITIRKTAERGHFDHGWLKTYHSFSFDQYRDPQHMNFRHLRVINEDFVLPERGFDTHAHRDMEIITYIVSGAVRHKDSAGNESTIRRDDVQCMTAGSGILHSEFNASSSETVHLLQIWILPSERGLSPAYAQKSFTDSDKLGRLCPIASPHGRDGSLTINQDAVVYASILNSDQSLEYAPEPSRHVWIQLIKGQLEVNNVGLIQGDGAGISDENALNIRSQKDSEFLLFDLA